jgi:hypothetical protein
VTAMRKSWASFSQVMALTLRRPLWDPEVHLLAGDG